MAQIKEVIQQIKQRIEVISYARDILGFPVSKEGDRCQGLSQSNKKNDALMFMKDSWYDFHLKEGGDVIALCQRVKHNGHFLDAIKDLASRCNLEIDGGHDYNWVEETKTFANTIQKWHENRTEEHTGYLRGRGFTREFLDSIKVGTKNNGNIIIPCLEWHGEKLLPCYYSEKVWPDGKYKHAPIEQSPNKCKYPYGLHTLKRNTPLIVTEGIADAMSVDQEGYQSLSPLGLQFNKEIMPRIMSACKGASKVYLCFDNDEPGQKGMHELGMKLFFRGIEFEALLLPNAGEDLNDYYCRQKSLDGLIDNSLEGLLYLGRNITDKKEFRNFIRKASSLFEKDDICELMAIVDETGNFSKTWLKETANMAKKMPPETDIVKRIAKDHTYFYNESLGFYEYSMGCFRRRQNTEVHSVIKGELGVYAKGTLFTSVRKHIESMAIGVDAINKGHYLNFVNGMFDLKENKIIDHDPAFLSTIQLNYCYDSEAQCPRWTEFIDEITEGDEEKQRLLQEMAGYILYPNNSLQKAFILIGAGSNGKSVLLNTIRKTFGEDNTTGIEIADLTESFQRVMLMESLVNICTEMSSTVAGAENFFKQIVAGDMVQGCFKHKDHIKFTPRVKFICATNAMFKSSDISEGFLRRLSFVQFNLAYKIDKKEIRRAHHRLADIGLEDKLETELAGIFNWCYAGYLRLQQQKRFTETTEHKYLLKDLKNAANPHMVFFDEAQSETYSRQDLWTEYSTWCFDQSFSTKTKGEFYVMTDLAMIKKYDDEGKTTYYKR